MDTEAQHQIGVHWGVNSKWLREITGAVEGNLMKPYDCLMYRGYSLESVRPELVGKMRRGGWGGSWGVGRVGCGGRGGGGGGVVGGHD